MSYPSFSVPCGYVDIPSELSTLTPMFQLSQSFLKLILRWLFDPTVVSNWFFVFMPVLRSTTPATAFAPYTVLIGPCTM